MTARREVRGWVMASWKEDVDEWGLSVAGNRDDLYDTPVVLIHADDHAALVAELERLREEIEAYEAIEATRNGTSPNRGIGRRRASSPEHTTDTPTDADRHTEDG